MTPTPAHLKTIGAAEAPFGEIDDAQRGPRACCAALLLASLTVACVVIIMIIV